MKNNTESREFPYKIILAEKELPRNWYNMRADMPGKVAPLLDPVTMEPVTAKALEKVFCKETAAQEMDETNRLAFFVLNSPFGEFGERENAIKQPKLSVLPFSGTPRLCSKSIDFSLIK